MRQVPGRAVRALVVCAVLLIVSQAVSAGGEQTIRSSAALLESIRVEDDLLELGGRMLYRWEVQAGSTSGRIVISLPAAVGPELENSGFWYESSSEGFIRAVRPLGTTLTNREALVGPDGTVRLEVELAGEARGHGSVSADGRRVRVLFTPREEQEEVVLPRLNGYEVVRLLHAAINLLEGEGKARVLANPRVATLDGVPAVVRTEERFPVFVTQISGDQSFRTKQDIIAGITLSILPRRSGEAGITTRITTEVTSVTGTTADGYPTTSTREAETIIRVRSGETIVIGGLLEARELENVCRIPILGRIPFLGRLFRTVRREQKQTDLYVIVTPYVIEEEL